MSGRLTLAGRIAGSGEAGYCPDCDQHMDDECPDACLGLIPGVLAACCGHGEVFDAYVVLGGEPDSAAWAVDSLTFRGLDALDFFSLAKRGVFIKGQPDTVWVLAEKPA